MDLFDVLKNLLRVPAVFVPKNGFAGLHKALSVIVAVCVSHNIVVREASSTLFASDGELLSVKIKHLLVGKPLITDVALDAVRTRLSVEGATAHIKVERSESRH
jgi:hypothetical protein